MKYRSKGIKFYRIPVKLPILEGKITWLPKMKHNVVSEIIFLKCLFRKFYHPKIGRVDQTNAMVIMIIHSEEMTYFHTPPLSSLVLSGSILTRTILRYVHL